jgi:ATPase subunit of ABC transporter with duplicated ATPase domains
MAMIMVSHDRSFLTETVDHIDIMMDGSILRPKSRLPQSPKNN